MIHHIQRTILDRLATSKNLRYSEIKPDDLDGNVFGYHLKSVMSDGYVEKNADGTYQLTSSGRNYIVHRYEDSSRSAHTIFLIVIRHGSSYLLRRRKVQPMLGYSGFIHGEPEPGMSVIEAATNRLRDKSNLDISLSIRGSALITQSLNDELQSYSHVVILYGETKSDNIKSGDETGENFWSEINAVDDLLPSCHDIIDLIESGDSWFEKSYDI